MIPFHTSVEMQMLFYSIELGLVQLVLATYFSVRERGVAWGVGPRDEGWPRIGNFGARVERAFKNFIETFPFFLAAVLFANVYDSHSQWSEWGAELYFWTRLVYLPLYVLAVPFTRTVAWTLSIVGIVMVLSATWTAT